MLYNRIAGVLELAIREMDRLLEQVNIRLERFATYSDCILQHKNNRGYEEYYRVEYTKKQRILRYIKKSEYYVVTGTVNYRFFNKLRLWLEEDIRLLRRQLRDLHRLDMESVFKALPEVYRRSTSEINEYYSSEAVASWKKQLEELKAKYPPSHPEHLTQRVYDNIYVRSKGEMAIYKLLMELGLPFVYEAPYISGNGRIYHPDFIVFNPRTGKTLIIEHDGAFGSPSKRTLTLEKIQAYFDDGLRPYQDYIFTFDYADGCIDIQLIQQLIELCA